MRNFLIALVVLVIALSFMTGKLSITQAPRGEVELETPNDQGEASEEIPEEMPSHEGELEEEEEPMAPEPEFPQSLTVLDALEYHPVDILEAPKHGAKSIGVVYGSLMHVDVAEELDSGFTKISTWDYYSMKPIVGYVPSELVKTAKPQGSYQVLVSIEEQKTYIYKDGVLEKTFINSTGVDENNAYTPKGVYLIGDRGGSFFSGKYQQGAYNWVRFNHNYLFHSVPFDATQTLIPEEADKLGQKASHGCIRHSIEDAQWFYDNIPKGTIVLIQD